VGTKGFSEAKGAEWTSGQCRPTSTSQAPIALLSEFSKLASCIPAYLISRHVPDGLGVVAAPLQSEAKAEEAAKALDRSKGVIIANLKQQVREEMAMA
jgi:hypothetical protein